MTSLTSGTYLRGEVSGWHRQQQVQRAEELDGRRVPKFSVEQVIFGPQIIADAGHQVDDAVAFSGQQRLASGGGGRGQHPPGG